MTGGAGMKNSLTKSTLPQAKRHHKPSTMTPQQQKLIKWSFAEIYFARDESAKIFYDRLFALAPVTRSLFKVDMEVQGKKLMDTLALAITTLSTPDRIGVFLEDTAKRHKDYGATPEHYSAVGAALLWMLEKQLGKDFTPDLKNAWTELYGRISKTMQEIADQSKRPSRPAEHPRPSS
jgi:nitric oxide dioxygenase